MEKDKFSGSELIVAIGFAFMFFWFGQEWAKGHFKPEIVTDTVVVERRDTIEIEKPTEIVRYIDRFDTIRLTDEPLIVVKIDSTAIIPIECAIYQDSTQNAKYEAYLSGFRPQLDSIRIECLQTETTITKIEREKARKIGVGVQLGVGLSPNGIAAPYVGIGLQYRIW